MRNFMQSNYGFIIGIIVGIILPIPFAVLVLSILGIVYDRVPEKLGMASKKLDYDLKVEKLLSRMFSK